MEIMFPNDFLGGQRRASGAVFPVVAASNEVNTVIEVNSSTDTKKGRHELCSEVGGGGLGSLGDGGMQPRLLDAPPHPVASPGGRHEQKG